MDFPAVLDLGFGADDAAIGLPADGLNSLRQAHAIVLSDLKGQFGIEFLCASRQRGQQATNQKCGEKSHRNLPVIEAVNEAIGSADKCGMSAVQLQRTGSQRLSSRPDVDPNANPATRIVLHARGVLLAIVAIHNLVAVDALFLVLAILR